MIERILSCLFLSIESILKDKKLNTKNDYMDVGEWYWRKEKLVTDLTDLVDDIPYFLS